TGYAEAVEVTYDLNTISLKKILHLFFLTIDPTSLNKQGNDQGTQYRTGIYYLNQHDKIIAESSLKRLAKLYQKPLVVECEPLKNVFVAEQWHQDYLNKKPNAYCHIPFGAFIMAKRSNPIKLAGKKRSMKNFIKKLYKRLNH
ncbi:MAG: peptide-methionine (S)-S-oxide reductase MsrA, partial [Bacteroidota bacterium]|nr:peptide-methionine (S)-S-oxide reductase MsrA [Bacteroidota bacterium]